MTDTTTTTTQPEQSNVARLRAELIQAVLDCSMAKRRRDELADALEAAMLEAEARERQGERNDLTLVKNLTEVNHNGKAAEQAAMLGRGRENQYTKSAMSNVGHSTEYSATLESAGITMRDAPPTLAEHKEHASNVGQVQTGPKVMSNVGHNSDYADTLENSDITRKMPGAGRGNKTTGNVADGLSEYTT